MKAFIFSVQGVEIEFLDANPSIWSGVSLTHSVRRLTVETASLAAGCDAALAFVNDDLSAPVLAALKAHGVSIVLMRCAGFDRVDVAAAAELGVRIMRVPAYSPHAVAEHAVALLMALNRRIVRAALRCREHDFYLRGLVGRDVHGKTVGCVGTGKIGAIFCKIMMGFGTRVIAYDLYQNTELKEAGVEYVSLETLLQESDFVSLHCPLLPSTKHIIDDEGILKMKTGES